MSPEKHKPSSESNTSSKKRKKNRVSDTSGRVTMESCSEDDDHNVTENPFSVERALDDAEVMSDQLASGASGVQNLPPSVPAAAADIKAPYVLGNFIL